MLFLCRAIAFLLFTIAHVKSQSVCPGEQHFGEECPRTCEDGNFVPPTCIPVMGCHCPNKLYINRKGSCVTVNTCLFENAQVNQPVSVSTFGKVFEQVPPNIECTGGRLFVTNGRCEIYCLELDNPPLCLLPPSPKCICPNGLFVDYSTGQCVLREDCPTISTRFPTRPPPPSPPSPPSPPTTTTEPLPPIPTVTVTTTSSTCQFFRTCVYCQRTCRNRLLNEFCDPTTCEPGCYCPDGQFLLDNNQCGVLVDCQLQFQRDRSDSSLEPIIGFPRFFCGFTCGALQTCARVGSNYLCLP